VNEQSDEQAVHEQPEPLRCFRRKRRPPVRYGIDEFTNKADVMSHVAYQAVEIEEPTTIDNALNSQYSREWKVAADLEYRALIKN